jgi:hypothetical protein
MSFYGQYTGFGGGGGVAAPKSMFTVLSDAGFESNILVCLDIADSSCYSGSGQNILDLHTSNMDFTRGGTDTATTDDPTFVGTAGDLLEGTYFRFDGGDLIDINVTVSSGLNSLHKDSADFTSIQIWQIPSTTDYTLFSMPDGNDDADIGTQHSLSGAAKPRITVRNGSSGYSFLATTDDAVSTGAVHFLGVSIDEATGSGGSFFYKDGAYDQVSSANTFDATYTSPSSSAADGVTLGATATDFHSKVQNLTRFFISAVLDFSVTKAQMDGIYADIKGRFGDLT